jgi:hypothetical protein
MKDWNVPRPVAAQIFMGCAHLCAFSEADFETGRHCGFPGRPGAPRRSP